MQDEHWRWNVDSVWQTFSSMYQEGWYWARAVNDIERHHHLSACLFFAVSCLEAFLNRQLRDTRPDLPEDVVMKRLRTTKLADKVMQWPSEICGRDISFGDELQKLLARYSDLRNELTHLKRRDHSLYQEVETISAEQVVDTVTRALVRIHESRRVSFEYWLFGWNYVGFNHDEAWPCLLNNQQFHYSLRAFGFDVPAADYDAANAWDQAHMTTLASYRLLRDEVYNRCSDIEPRQGRFPSGPRLCKRWWDRDLIGT